MNYRHYNAQIAGRESVELFTVIFFAKRREKAAGLVMGCKKNGIKVWVPQYGLEGTIFINHTNKAITPPKMNSARKMAMMRIFTLQRY